MIRKGHKGLHYVIFVYDYDESSSDTLASTKASVNIYGLKGPML
jgi:hypothetical protein